MGGVGGVDNGPASPAASALTDLVMGTPRPSTTTTSGASGASGTTSAGGAAGMTCNSSTAAVYPSTRSTHISTHEHSYNDLHDPYFGEKGQSLDAAFMIR